MDHDARQLKPALLNTVRGSGYEELLLVVAVSSGLERRRQRRRRQRVNAVDVNAINVNTVNVNAVNVNQSTHQRR